MSWKEIEGLELDARVELIRALLLRELAEVERLAGPSHGRKGG